MDGLYALAGILALSLLAYLIAALMRPEAF